jgi:hypothetical protein
MLVKTKGQQARSRKSRLLAFVSYGASFGAAERNWTVKAEGSNPSSSISVTAAQLVERPIGGRVYAGSSPVRHHYLTPRCQLIAGNGAYPRTEAKGQGCHTAVILAQVTEESKGQNDVPQLPYRMPQVWKNSQSPAAISLLPMLQDLL